MVVLTRSKARQQFTQQQKQPCCKGEEKEKEKQMCVICQDVIHETNRVVLACNHTFHGNCLLKSIVKYRNNKCPLCRQTIDEEHELHPAVLNGTIVLSVRQAMIERYATTYVNSLTSNSSITALIQRLLLLRNSQTPQNEFFKSLIIDFSNILISSLTFSAERFNGMSLFLPMVITQDEEEPAQDPPPSSAAPAASAAIESDDYPWGGDNF